MPYCEVMLLLIAQECDAHLPPSPCFSSPAPCTAAACASYVSQAGGAGGQGLSEAAGLGQSSAFQRKKFTLPAAPGMPSAPCYQFLGYRSSAAPAKQPRRRTIWLGLGLGDESKGMVLPPVLPLLRQAAQRHAGRRRHRVLPPTPGGLVWARMPILGKVRVSPGRRCCAARQPPHFHRSTPNEGGPWAAGTALRLAKTFE